MKFVSYPDLPLLLFAKSRYIWMLARVPKSAIRLFLSILLFTCIAPSAVAQELKIDSLNLEEDETANRYYNQNLKIEPTLAIDNYRTSLQIHRLNHNEPGEAEVLVNLARVYRRQQPDSTVILARQALEITQRINKKDVLADAAYLLSQTYEALGQYQLALEMQKLHRNTRDSMFNQEVQASVLRSEAQYEYNKKQLQDRIAFEQEITKTKLNAQLYYFLLLGLAVLLFVAGYMYLHKRNAKYQAERTEALLRISQLRESMAKQTLAASGTGEKPLLNKEKIETAVGTKLGDTSWNILRLLLENPSISNYEISQSLYLSEESVSSSLRRMYSIFDIHSGHSKNHKIALLTKVVELSISD